MDMRIQQGLYDATQNKWIIDREDPLLKIVFYDGIKLLLVLYALGMFAILLFFHRFNISRHFRLPILIALLTIVLVPSLVNELKSVTNVPCPKEVTLFGGTLPHVDVLDRWPENVRPIELPGCFPAAHASGGFSLLALILLAKPDQRRNRILIGLFALGVGFVIGGYKMAIGDHFLSHTLVSMFISWLVIALLCAVLSKRSPLSGQTR